MKVSVITISYNVVSVIEKTIKSVIEQNSDDFEYIIVDGNSTDGTVDVIRKYDSHITQWISEPDKGIYNAMNKGVSLASGDYCIFMNAGDVFYSNDVLKIVNSQLDGKTSIIMGNQVYVNSKGFSHYGHHWKSVTLRCLFRGSLFHQASFIRRSDLLSTPYDESLRMVSDWKFAHDILIQQNKAYKGIDINVCLFDTGGITNTNVELRIRECKQVLDSMYPKKVQADYIHDEITYKKWWNINRYIIFIQRKYNHVRYRIKLSRKVFKRMSYLSRN